MIGLDMETGRKRKKPGPGPERAGKPASDAEELALLRERNRFLEIENAYLKKLDALVSEREAAEAKAKRRKP